MKELTEEQLVALRRSNLRNWIFTICQHDKQSQFIAKHDLNQSEISGLLRKKNFAAKKARILERQTGMPFMYLDTMHDDDLADQSTHLRNDIVIDQCNDVRGSMGHGVILNDQPGQITGLSVTMEWAEKNIPANTGNNNLRVVTGFGDSMRPMYNPGDPLLVDSGIHDCNVDGVYFFRIGDEGFIKRLQRVPGLGIRAISENTKYETWTITEDMDFEVFGRVLKVWTGTDF